VSRRAQRRSRLIAAGDQRARRRDTGEVSRSSAPPAPARKQGNTRGQRPRKTTGSTRTTAHNTTASNSAGDTAQGNARSQPHPSPGLFDDASNLKCFRLGSQGDPSLKFVAGAVCWFRTSEWGVSRHRNSVPQVIGMAGSRQVPESARSRSATPEVAFPKAVPPRSSRGSTRVCRSHPASALVAGLNHPGGGMREHRNGQ
jgi:hypothetical protein